MPGESAPRGLTERAGGLLGRDPFGPLGQAREAC
jgi:hypothetical protein